MFFGIWNCKVDNKWRLTLPAAIRDGLDEIVLLEKEDDGCIQIHHRNNIQKDFFPIFIVKVKQCKDRQKRILIPLVLRKSTSFYLGKRVTLSGKGDYLEIWPRP